MEIVAFRAEVPTRKLSDFDTVRRALETIPPIPRTPLQGTENSQINGQAVSHRSPTAYQAKDKLQRVEAETSSTVPIVSRDETNKKATGGTRPDITQGQSSQPPSVPETSSPNSPPRTKRQSDDFVNEASTARSHELMCVSRGSNPLFRYEQKTFISPQMPIRQEIADNWNYQLRERFEDALRNMLQDLDSPPMCLAVECMMAGKDPRRMKPCIIVTCDSEELRKTLSKAIKKLSWISSSGLQCIAIVQPIRELQNVSDSSITALAIFIPSGLMISLLIWFLWYKIRHTNDRRMTDVENVVAETAHVSSLGSLDHRRSVGNFNGRRIISRLSVHAEEPEDQIPTMANREATVTTTMDNGSAPKFGKRENLAKSSTQDNKSKTAFSVSEVSLKPDNERSGNVDLRNSPILLTDYAREGNTLCSAHLKSSSSAHKDFTCTLGGLIVVYMLGQPEVYALTAGHAWLDNPTTTPEGFAKPHQASKSSDAPRLTDSPEPSNVHGMTSGPTSSQKAVQEVELDILPTTIATSVVSGGNTSTSFVESARTNTRSTTRTRSNTFYGGRRRLARALLAAGHRHGNPRDVDQLEFESGKVREFPLIPGEEQHDEVLPHSQPPSFPEFESGKVRSFPPIPGEEQRNEMLPNSRPPSFTSVAPDGQSRQLGELYCIETRATDWALIKITDPFMLVENTMPFKHNFRHGGILKEFSLKSGMKPGEVAVNAGISGPQMGELSQCSSSLWVRNQFLTARQITLGECLVPGDSGSWVVRGSTVYGQIVAARQGTPWAYMLPMEDILDSIQDKLQATSVELYPPSEIPGTPKGLRAGASSQSLNQAFAKELRGKLPIGAWRSQEELQWMHERQKAIQRIILEQKAEEQSSKEQALRKMPKLPKKNFDLGLKFLAGLIEDEEPDNQPPPSATGLHTESQSAVTGDERPVRSATDATSLFTAVSGWKGAPST